MTDKSPDWALRQFSGRFERPIAINMNAFMKAWSLSPGIIAWVEGDMRPTLTVPLFVSDAELIKQGFLMPYFQDTLRSRKITIEADAFSEPLCVPPDLVQYVNDFHIAVGSPWRANAPVPHPFRLDYDCRSSLKGMIEVMCMRLEEPAVLEPSV